MDLKKLKRGEIFDDIIFLCYFDHYLLTLKKLDE
jgi:hypothetical protein